MQAFDVRTGKPRWTFKVIPRAGEFGNETWENDSWEYTGKANLWSLISADEEPGLRIFRCRARPTTCTEGIGLATISSATRSSPCKCATGERVWHYQIVHHDLWDYDLPAAPILADITVGGAADQGCRAAHEAGVCLRLRSATGQPGVADRRAARAHVGHAGRAHLAHAAVPHQAAAVRSPGRHGRRPDRLHAGAARGSARARQAVPDWAAVHAAHGAERRAERRQGNGAASRFGRRRRLAGRRVRSGDGHSLRRIDHRPVRRRHRQGRSGANQPRLRAWRARLSRRAAGAAAPQAAVRPHHGDRSEQGRAALDGGQRRRPARPSAAEAAQSAAARQPRSQRAAA